ncbi:MAG: WYL domain-containing protein [Gordonia sp. (in: high G+C Gram-positive bacteria)]
MSPTTRSTENSQRPPNPTARLLRLLGLLQSRPRWSGAELAERLGVSARTLRYDISKLRDLGYDVHAEAGVAGGYALRPGTVLPPLLLTDDEAVAIAIGLRLAAGGTGDESGGPGEAALTALAKLEQVVPWRLRGRVGTLRAFTETVGHRERTTDPDDVVFLAGACRDHRRVRFDYTSRDGRSATREVEPYRVVQLSGAWHLLAFAPDRDDWRQFRLDRMTLRRPEGARFRPREAPTSEAMLAATDERFRQFRATVVVAAPAAVVSGRVPDVVPVERVDDDHCRVWASGRSPSDVAINLLLLDHDFVLEETTPDVRAALDALGNRIAAAGRPRLR